VEYEFFYIVVQKIKIGKQIMKKTFIGGTKNLLRAGALAMAIGFGAGCAVMPEDELENDEWTKNSSISSPKTGVSCDEIKNVE